jgi:hypothetical protein
MSASSTTTSLTYQCVPLNLTRMLTGTSVVKEDLTWRIGTAHLHIPSGAGLLLTPRPPPTSISRGGRGSAGTEWPQTELGEPFLAGRLIGDGARVHSR